MLPNHHKMHKTKMKFICFFIVLMTILLDQVTKFLVIEVLFEKHFWNENLFSQLLYYHQKELNSFLNIVLVGNKGVSFSFLTASTIWQTWLLIALAALIIILLVRILWTVNSRFFALSLCLILGGGIGNIIDRIRLHAVIDFIDVHYKNWHFPAFNLADSFITIGVILMAIYVLFLDQDKNEQQ